MTRSWVLVLVLLATAAWTGSASAWYHDYFPSGADGSFGTHDAEGYAINANGRARIAKTTQHYGFVGFRNEKSDGADDVAFGKSKKIAGTNPVQYVNDTADGSFLGEWLGTAPGAAAPDKKVIEATLYIRARWDVPDDSNDLDYCNANHAAGTYLNEPITVVGFRAANAGEFTDVDAAGASVVQGCCKAFDAVDGNLKAGMMGAPAWRMGAPTNGTAYAFQGDVGPAAEMWQVSWIDGNNPGATLAAGTAPFDTDNDGAGGWSGPMGATQSSIQDALWGFDWLLIHSTAHLVNSQNWVGTMCTTKASGGGWDPREQAVDGTASQGWYAVPLDRELAYWMANDPELKGLVFSARTVAQYGNHTFWTRDQNSDKNGPYAPYLDVWATVMGDGDNDGCNDLSDLTYLALAWMSYPGAENWNPECDFNYDYSVDLSDLTLLALNFNTCVPLED